MGIIEVILSGIAFGFLGIFGKAAFQIGMTSGELLAFRFLFASSIMCVFLLLSQPKLLKLPKDKVIKCVLLGLLACGLTTCFFEALRGLSVSLTILLLYLYPVMVSLGAFFIFKEKLTPLALVALPLCCVGLSFLVWGDIKINNPVALIFGFGSAIFYSVYILASRRWLNETSLLSSAFYIQLTTALVFCLIHLKSWERSKEVVQSGWPLLLGISVICTITAMLLLLSGLKKLTLAETSILSAAEPITAIVAASILFDEKLSPVQGIGALLVLGALILTSLPRNFLSKKT